MAGRLIKIHKLEQWIDRVHNGINCEHVMDIDLFTYSTLPKCKWGWVTLRLYSLAQDYIKKQGYDMKIGLYGEIIVPKKERLRKLRYIQDFRLSKKRPFNLMIYHSAELVGLRRGYILLENISTQYGTNVWLCRYQDDPKAVYYIQIEELDNRHRHLMSQFQK